MKVFFFLFKFVFNYFFLFFKAELSNERRLATNSVVIVERKVGDFQPEPIHVDNMNSK